MADLAVEHVQCDIVSDGDTFTISDVGDVNKAFLYNASSRLRSGGRLDSPSNIHHNDLSTALRLTSATQITGQLSDSETDTHRHRIQVVSYTGSAGGAHEFVVRWRGSVTVPAASATATQSMAGAGISNRNDCIPMLGGYTHGAWGRGTAATMGPYAHLDSSGDLVVGRAIGSGPSDVVVFVEVVEFVGSAWSVGHARITGKAGTQTNHTLRADSDGTSGAAFDVGAWGDALIVPHVGSTNSVRLDSFGAHVYPASGTEAITHEMFSASPSFAGYEAFTHVLVNADLAVTRYTAGINLGVGDNDITITAVPDIATTLVGWTHMTSGGGNAYGRGDGTTYLKNATTASMWVHRSGNAGEYSMDVVDLSGLVGATSFAGLAAVTQADQASSASGNFDAPTFSATGAPAQADQTSTASGSFTNPALSGSGAPTQADQTATASGAFTAPVFTATGSPSQADQTANGTGNFDAPAFSASGAPSQADQTATASGNYDPAVVSGSGAPTQDGQTSTGVGVLTVMFDAVRRFESSTVSSAVGTSVTVSRTEGELI